MQFTIVEVYPADAGKAQRPKRPKSRSNTWSGLTRSPTIGRSPQYLAETAEPRSLRNACKGLDLDRRARRVQPVPRRHGSAVGHFRQPPHAPLSRIVDPRGLAARSGAPAGRLGYLLVGP